MSSNSVLSNMGKFSGENVVEANYETEIREENNELRPELTLSASDKDVVQVKTKTQTGNIRQAMNGPLMLGAILSHSTSEKGHFCERCEIEVKPSAERSQIEIRKEPSFSGSLMLPARASANSLLASIRSLGGFRDSLDDESKANLVQIKGRFSVTSENVDLVKGSSLRKSTSLGNWIFYPKQMPFGQSPRKSVIVQHLHHCSSPTLRIFCSRHQFISSPKWKIAPCTSKLGK